MIDMVPKPKRPEGYGPVYPMFPRGGWEPGHLGDPSIRGRGDISNPINHLRPFPFPTLPPKDSIEDALQRERDKSRAIGIGTKLGGTKAFMGGGGIGVYNPPENTSPIGMTASGGPQYADEALRQRFQEAIEKFIPGAKGSISVRRINLGD